MTNSTDLLPPAGTTHTIKPEHSKSPLWNVIKALGNKCFYYNGTQWVDSIAEGYLDYYLKFYDAVTHETIPTETPEETEAFNKMKPYEFDEHVSVAKVPSEKMKVALKEADGDGFMSRCMVIPVSIEPVMGGYSVGYKLPHKEDAEEDKPVFTQAMADAGELPPIGSEAMFYCSVPEDFSFSLRNGDVVKIIHHYSPCSDGCNVAVFIFNDKGGGDVSQAIPSCFKPIDTRTPKQKAVDAALAEWPVADAITLGVAYDVWNK